ncbi:MAG: IclR family transcriptional regulator [Acidobacteria bacterium]|nr:IclR family transcriptional regulator [Acidobacteriota bacterium]
MSLSDANSVERAFAILEFLNTSRRGWNISELSRKLELPKSSTHVLISTLGRLGYIKETTAGRRFQLSAKMYGLGIKALRTTPLSEVALSHMHWAVQQTGLTSHVGILEKGQVIFIQKVDGRGIIKFDTYLGKCSELHCTGLGKALLAYQPEETIKSILAKHQFSRFTKNTISTADGFLAELGKVRKNGYAIDNEEEELGVRCIAVPIFEHGEPVAAISFTGTTSQLSMDALKKVVETAKAASACISAQF